MNAVEQNLVNWKESLLPSIPVGGLLSRNPVAYKWKAPFRVWMLREAVFWRLHDLMTQSYALYQQGHGLGARILLRSGFESLATLIYLNRLMQQVLEGKLNFHAFGDKTTTLLLGSRNNERGPRSLNIVTLLEKCDKRYPGLMALYADLSESAHPSYEGLCLGYSKIDHDEYETKFSNRWMKLYGDRHLGSMELCMETKLDIDQEVAELRKELKQARRLIVALQSREVKAASRDLGNEELEIEMEAHSGRARMVLRPALHPDAARTLREFAAKVIDGTVVQH